MINITLPDQSIKRFENPPTGMEIASTISEGFARNCVAMEIDGQLIGDFADLNGYLVFHTRVGQTIQISVLRDGQRIVVPLELGARP